MIKQDEQGYWIYEGDTFTIRMTRYSDPQRLHLARNAARYLGKSDIENIRRPLSVIKKGHVAEVFRGEHVEFEFIDVSKEVYDHIITYTTRNMRVAGGNRALVSDDYTMPSDKMKILSDVEWAIKNSMESYKTLLDRGETPQVARSAMPVAAKMNIFVYQFNFLTLGQSVFAQRVWDKGAQGNTVKVIDGMLKLCENIDKELWDTFYKYMGTPALRWREVKRKLEVQHITVHQLLNELHALALSGEGDPDESVLDYLDRKYGDIKTMW
jgi:hypothetical protein